MQYYYTILETSKNCAFAFFECTNGDYGVLEPLNYDVEVGDILQPISSKDAPHCGSQTFIVNGRNRIDVHVDELDFKERAYNLFLKYTK